MVFVEFRGFSKRREDYMNDEAFRALQNTLFEAPKAGDVIKGTGSIWVNTKARTLEDFCVILQGSRAGKSIHSGAIPSYRAVSYFTGKELWRLNSFAGNL